MNSLVILLIVLVLFLIGRELVCWYWKLNKIIELLEDIKKSLNKEDKKGE